MLVLVLVPTAAATGLGYLGRWWWVADLATHGRVVLAVAAAATAIGFLALRRWRWAGLSLGVVLLNLPGAAPLFVPRDVETGTSTVRLLHLNVYTGNRAHNQVINLIENAQADIVFLQEVDQRWIQALRAGLEGYTVLLQRPRADNFGIVMFARQALPIHVQIDDARLADDQGLSDDLPVIVAEIRLEGRPLRVMSAHPLPPVSRAYAAERDAQLSATGVWAARQDVPVVIVGDLNTTPWSHAFGLLTQPAGLINSQRGFGIQPTWPSPRVGLPLIPIDHCVHSPGLVTAHRAIGPDVGSDHRPLIVDLAWAAP